MKDVGLAGPMSPDTGDAPRLEMLNYEYNTLMSSMHVGVSKHLLDEYFTVIWANDFYYKSIKYSKEEYEALFHNHVNEYYQNDQEEYKSIGTSLLTALEKNQPGYELICRMPQKGGTYIWIRVVGTFTQETINGAPVIYSVFTDVTDLVQTRMEQSITYNNLPGFIAKFKIGEHRHVEFVDANERFMDFFGRRGPGDAPYVLADLDIERNRRAMDENYHLMRAGKPVHFVVQARDKDDNEAWLQLNGDCIDRQNGDPVYLVIYIDITDITEQRELQKKLEERSEMLRNALELAERANLAKSDFLSRMSHDIRTPMNAIMGMVAIARENREDPARVQDCLEKVETSAKFLLALINDILDMSKIESGKMVLKKRKFDFAAFIRDLSTLFYTEAQKKQVHFHVSVGLDLKEAYIGDPLKLNQILINLLSNAIKFTDPGGNVSLTVESGKQADKTSELIFTVQDDGAGMSEDFQTKMFQPFEQDSSQRENRGGSGLGLAIAGNYARMMNGGIDVKSAPGKGSRFVVRVWLGSAEEKADPLDLKKRFQDMKALVVDPDPGNCEYAVGLLRRFGVQAQWAVSCQEARETLAAANVAGAPFTLAIIDGKMPHMDGVELARQLHERFADNGLLVAVAAYDPTGVQMKARAAGLDFFLQKPLFPSTLYDFLISLTQGEPLVVERAGKERFNGERVLLAEDNKMNREIAETLLESRNLHVESARDGREAVELFRSRQPGYYLAILMDIQMPVMNGLEAAAVIRAMDKADALTVPIIALSANAFDEDVEKSLEAGMNGHISKPIDIPSLFEALRNLQK